MGKEIDDIEFDELIAEKRHKELLEILKAGFKNLLGKPPDTSTAAAIEKMANGLSKLLSEQKSVTVNSPDVNVEVNSKDFTSSIEKLSQELLEELRKFNSRPVATQFDVEYSNWNVRTVKILYTAADKLNYKK